MIFPSSLAGFLWIFWTLLQRDYCICAVLGGTKEAKLINATVEEGLQIEADYANAGKTSQAAALLLLGVALVTAFVILSVQRCCFQREIGSLPSSYQYQKLECEAVSPDESFVELQVMLSRIFPHQNENGGKKVFTGVVFDNCNFTFSARDAGSSTTDYSVVPKK